MCFPKESSRMRNPLICHNTNHSFIVLTDYTKSYGCPDFKINPTQILLLFCVPCQSLNLGWDTAGTWWAPTGRTARVNIHFRARRSERCSRWERAEPEVQLWGQEFHFIFPSWPVHLAPSFLSFILIFFFFTFFTKVGMKARLGREKACYPLASWRCWAARLYS